jgi:aminocarboxymuconate-semialdehyde decarboxylase
MMFTCAPADLRSGSASTSARRGRVVRKGNKSLRVDIHCHYNNPDAEAMVAHLNPVQHEPLFKFSNAPTREVNKAQSENRRPQLSTIEVRLKDMDKMGIDIQAVSPAPNQYFYWTEPELGRELARKINDRLAEIVAKWPDRFVALGTVPMQNAEYAVAELERCVKQLGLRGIEINTNVNGKNLTDEELGLDKVFAKAQELDVVIFLHPGGFTHADRLTRHYFNNVIGNPLETTIAVSHLIFDGVLDRYPKLKVVTAHGGGFLSFYNARMDHAHGARSDCRLVIKKKPTSYLKKLHFDTITFDRTMLKTLIDTYGADHVLLGTDYPYDMGMYKPVEFIDGVAKLGRDDKAKIMGGNAARLLKIKR